MRERLLDFLKCPDCGGEAFCAEAFRREGDRLMEGTLACAACGRGGPILDGIPRLVPGELQAAVLARFPGFRGPVPPPFTPKGPADGLEGIARTLRNYTQDDQAGWHTAAPELRAVCESASDYMRYPVPLDFYRGKVGLDAGCGFGKDVFRVARDGGAEVVGADLSGRIDVAGLATADLPKVHLIQADLYTLPLKPACFDFVMSLGMLHHLPDPALGFRRLPPLLKPGGRIQVWVYKRGGENLSVAFFEAVRKITGRWPYVLHAVMGWTAGIGQWLSCTLPVKVLQALGRDDLARRIPFYENAALPLSSVAGNWIDNFHVPLWHSHRREEVAAWFQEAGLKDVALPDYPNDEGTWMGHALGTKP